MEYYRIHFAKTGREEELDRFLRQIDGETDTHGDIHLSGKIARGQIKKFHLDAGLNMRVWELVFQQPVILHKDGLPAPQHNNTLSAFYLLTPEHIALKSVGDHQQFSRAWSRDVLLISDDVRMELQVQGHHPIQIIEFTISTWWYEQQLKSAEAAKKNIPDIEEWNFPIIKIEPCSSRDTLVTNKMFHIAMREHHESPPLQALSACMITDLLSNALTADSKKMPMYKDVYYEKIMQVEAILQEHLQKNLPPLAAIAQQVELSESTLKRYFKIFFGTSVYDYYLQKKMHLAKGMLLEKMMTVNEIADMMGYEKVSNFIDIFKKHHGFSPGAIKKRWMLQKLG